MTEVMLELTVAKIEMTMLIFEMMVKILLK